MTKLISKKFVKGEYVGQTVNFPIVGSLEFASDGSIEVPEDKVAEFIKATSDSFNFVALDKKGKKIVTKEEAEKDLEQEEDLAIKELLSEASSNELLKMAGESGFGPEAANLSDERLRQELLKVLKKKIKEEQQQVKTEDKEEKKKRGRKAKVQ